MNMLSLLLNKAQIYRIELSDEKINKEICTSIKTTHEHIDEFKEILGNKHVTNKEEESLRIYKMLLRILRKVNTLISDISKIEKIEETKSHFIKIHDEQYRDDKLEQLSKIKYVLDSLILIIEQNPSINDYKTEVLDQMTKDVLELEELMNKVLKDDLELDRVYRALCEL